MKRIEDIKNFDDIDTYYEIASTVEEIFEDRVEAHKHLVTANEEIERLNNIVNKAIEYLESYNTDFKNCKFGEAPISMRELGDLLDILKGSDKE